MARRASTEIEREAAELLANALDGLGIEAAVSYDENHRDRSGADFTVDVGGRQFEAEVKTVVTAAHGDQLARSPRDRDRPVIVLAQRIASDAKQVLRDRGVNFFDMRGELRIVDPPLIIDTRVPAASGSLSAPVGPLASQVAKEVAIGCLLTPDQRHGVRELARLLARAPSAVSAAMSGLRSAGLLTSAGEPMRPDLFHELLSVWRRRPVPLAEPARTRHRVETQPGSASASTTSVAPPAGHSPTRSPRPPGACRSWPAATTRRTSTSPRRPNYALPGRCSAAPSMPPTGPAPSRWRPSGWSAVNASITPRHPGGGGPSSTTSSPPSTSPKTAHAGSKRYPTGNPRASSVPGEQVVLLGDSEGRLRSGQVVLPWTGPPVHPRSPPASSVRRPTPRGLTDDDLALVARFGAALLDPNDPSLPLD